MTMPFKPGNAIGNIRRKSARPANAIGNIRKQSYKKQYGALGAHEKLQSMAKNRLSKMGRM